MPRRRNPTCTACGDLGYVTLLMVDNVTLEHPRADLCPYRCDRSKPIAALIGHQFERGEERKREAIDRVLKDERARPVPMILDCPFCHARHIDDGAQATTPHRTHACQSCGRLWAPAVVPTVGVQFLPGCKNGTP